MIDWRKAFSLISSRDHCQRSSPSQISDKPWAGFKTAQNLSPGFAEWSCAVVITTTPQPQKVLYVLLRIHMGLVYTPPAFQSYINECLTGIRDLASIAYFDNILCFGKTSEEHLENSHKVLPRLESWRIKLKAKRCYLFQAKVTSSRLESWGIKLKANKCYFFQAKVKYLGKVISKNRFRPDPVDTQA